MCPSLEAASSVFHPSVCPMIYLESESLRIFKFGGGMVLDMSNWES